MSPNRPSVALPKLAYSPLQVSEMLEEKVEAINRHCRTQALKGAYKTGERHPRGVSRQQLLTIICKHGPGSERTRIVPPTVYPPETVDDNR